MHLNVSLTDGNFLLSTSLVHPNEKSQSYFPPFGMRNLPDSGPITINGL
jgi:hypothetical protein